jgi:DNA-binding transcriptional LysR family regulator
LRIATYDNIACGILSGLGSALISDFPQLSISVGGPNSRILGDLSGGKFDCALIAQPRVLTGLEYKTLFNERYGLFISRSLFSKSGLSKNESLRIGDLKNHKIIAMPDAIAGANKNIDRLLWEIGLTSIISIDSYEVAIQLVRDGCGIGILPFSTAWRDVREKRLRELVVKEVPRSTFGRHDLTLCWNPKEKHPGVEHFESVLTECFAKIRA